VLHVLLLAAENAVLGTRGCEQVTPTPLTPAWAGAGGWAARVRLSRFPLPSPGLSLSARSLPPPLDTGPRHSNSNRISPPAHKQPQSALHRPTPGHLPIPMSRPIP